MTLSGYEQARREGRERHPIKKGKCKCGRRMMWNKKESKPTECATCKTLGYEESQRSFLRLNMHRAEVIPAK